MDISTISNDWGFVADPVSLSGRCQAVVQGPPSLDCVEHSLPGERLGLLGVYPLSGGMIVSTNDLVFNSPAIERLLAEYRRPEQSQGDLGNGYVAWANGREDILSFIEGCESQFASQLGFAVSVTPELYQDFDEEGNLELEGLCLSVDYGVDFDPEVILRLEEELLTQVVFPAADRMDVLIILDSIYG